MPYLISGLTAAIIVILLGITCYTLYKELLAQKQMVQHYKIKSKIIKQANSALYNIVESQHKERDIVISHLHDNLGSMLAVLKFNFENLKMRTTELGQTDYSLYDRTDLLIAEGYQKVQLLSHAQNEGAFAENSLLPAIKTFTEKAAAISGVAISVTSFGFISRVSNIIEVTVFLALQQLIAAIVLNDYVGTINIGLTQHDDFINIMIESETSASLINSLKTLAVVKQHLYIIKGELSVDSVPGKGTTIIINIPI